MDESGLGIYPAFTIDGQQPSRETVSPSQHKKNETFTSASARQFGVRPRVRAARIYVQHIPRRAGGEAAETQMHSGGAAQRWRRLRRCRLNSEPISGLGGGI